MLRGVQITLTGNTDGNGQLLIPEKIHILKKGIFETPILQGTIDGPTTTYLSPSGEAWGTWTTTIIGGESPYYYQDKILYETGQIYSSAFDSDSRKHSFTYWFNKSGKYVVEITVQSNNLRHPKWVLTKNVEVKEEQQIPYTYCIVSFQVLEELKETDPDTGEVLVDPDTGEELPSFNMLSSIGFLANGSFTGTKFEGTIDPIPYAAGGSQCTGDLTLTINSDKKQLINFDAYLECDTAVTEAEGGGIPLTEYEDFDYIGIEGYAEGKTICSYISYLNIGYLSIPRKFIDHECNESSEIKVQCYKKKDMPG